MLYRKLKRTWSNGYGNYIPKMRETFPELSKISNEEMCDRWIKLDIEFYTENTTPVNFYMRLTLPFALITLLLMFIGLPVAFLITGKWGYSLNNKNYIYNWLKSLSLN